MRFIRFLIFVVLVSISTLFSCVSEQERQAMNRQRIARELAERESEEQKQREIDALEEQSRILKETYDRYINNRLETGATPYVYLYGANKRCSEWGCSSIKVSTPSTSEVLVLIKKNEIVVRHAYIRASDSYTFQMPNGTYQPFFYYGNGWNPEKELMETESGTVIGGFVSGEHFSKDNPQELENNRLEYTLILQQSGNFQEKSSSAEEVF